jgi:predicted RND superfamily exporter protein
MTRIMLGSTAMTRKTALEPSVQEKPQPALLAVALTVAGIVSIVFTTCYAYHIGL